MDTDLVLFDNKRNVYIAQIEPKLARCAGPRRPAVRADRIAPLGHRSLQVSRRRALHQVGRRDAETLRRGTGVVRQHALDR